MSITVVFDKNNEVLVNCQVSDAVGDWVCVREIDAGGVTEVAKADVREATDMPIHGVIIDKVTNTSCVVKTQGMVEIFTGLTPEAFYWSTDDGMTAGVPIIIDGMIHTQRLGKAISSTIFYVNIDKTVYGRRS